MERLVFFRNFRDFFVDFFVVIGSDLFLAHKGVIVEAVLERRADAQMSAVGVLNGLAQHMGTGVPESLFAFRFFEFVEHDLAIRIERTHHVPRLHLDFFFRGVVHLAFFLIFASDRAFFKGESRFLRVMDGRNDETLGQFLGNLFSNVKRSGLISNTRHFFAILERDGNGRRGLGIKNGGLLFIQSFENLNSMRDIIRALARSEGASHFARFGDLTGGGLFGTFSCFH